MTGSALPVADVALRLGRVGSLCETERLDGLVVTNLDNVRYLTGFTGSSAMIVLGPGGGLLTTDGRYAQQAAAELDAAGVVCEVAIGTLAEQRDALVGWLAGQGRVGVEADTMTLSEHGALSGAVGDVELVPTSGLVEGLRLVKDDGEVARIEAAAAIADDALVAVRAVLAQRPTEIEFARELDRTMLDGGAEALSFETICASGPNSARPHARPGSRRIESGDVVVLDFGAVVDGYHSDMTRTFVVGEPDPDVAALLALVTDAQQCGVEAVGDGVACSAVDAACRDVIAAAGHGDEFVHGSGHGVGLVIHEAPWVNPRSDDVLGVGQVVTVEPGVYRPGVAGVRVEDTVVVTADGARRLTHSPKDNVVG